MLHELLPVGADVDGQDVAGWSALWHAAVRGALGVVVHLAENLGASPTLADRHGSSPMYAAAGAPGGQPNRDAAGGPTYTTAGISQWYSGWLATAGRSPSRTSSASPRS